MLVALPMTAIVGGAAIAIGWRASEQAMHPPPAENTTGLTDFPKLDAQPVRVQGWSGAVLSGRFFAGETKATVILSHGYGGSQDELLRVAAALHTGGLSVFTYDLRGCGSSSGDITFGALEQDDLRAVIDYLVGRPDVDADRIGAYGFSMGGGTTLLAAAADRRIAAVAADSAWSNVKHWLRPTLKSLIRPNARFSPLALKLVELRQHVDLDRLRPADSVAAISPRPLLLLHGDADEVVPVADARENASRAGANAELWVVPGAQHGASLAVGGAASSTRLVDFFRDALGRGSSE